MVVLSTLESLPTHIVASSSTSLYSFCNSCFELLIIATEPVSNTQGLTLNTSNVHINNMHIIYTFVHFAILLIHQVLGAVLLPVTISFAVEALSFSRGLALGFFMGVATCLPFFLKFPFFPLPFYLKLVVLSTINI